MNHAILSAFHSLPYPLRCIAASMQGMRLKQWRYSSRTDQLVEDALERDSWSARQWLDWQQERLSHVLHHAATTVPFYQRLWSRRRQRGDQRSWDYIDNWPFLEKESVREYPEAFLAESSIRQPTFLDQTSGTTGTPLKLWRTRDTLVQRYALYEARRLRWHGLTRADRWANIGGQLVADVRRQHSPFWVWNRPLNQLYISSYHLSPELALAAVEAIRTHRVTHLLGYTSSLESLANAALDREESFPELRLITTNAEPIDRLQRSKIQNAFQAPVRESYGMVELVSAASECQAGGLHIWPEMGWAEILPDQDSLSGELIATSLLDLHMPLVRYRTGDRAHFAEHPHACPCGRQLPLLASMGGRNDDVLWTADGRAVGRLDPVFKADLPVRQAQIVQESLGSIRVRCVPAAGFDRRTEATIRRRLRERLGPVHVRVETAKGLPRGPNGKVRAVESRLTALELSELRNQLRRAG